MARLDSYDKHEHGMDKYLSHYGWHFSKPMYEWSVSLMKDRSGNRVEPTGFDKAKNMLGQYGVDISRTGYDAVYVLDMARADFLGSSITAEKNLCQFVSDYMSDPDGYDGVAFTRFYADCIGKGIPIMWEDML